MKPHIFFNILIQYLILFLSIYSYFGFESVKLLLSMLLIFIIFMPSFIEFILKIEIKNIIHYTVTASCFLLFLILIAI